jgi:hypothetical protein
MASLNATSTVPPPSQSHLERGYGASSTPKTNLPFSTAAADLASPPGNPSIASPLSQSAYGKFNEEWEAPGRPKSELLTTMERSNSILSQGDTVLPSRGGTLRKKSSIKRTGSLKRSSSRRSSRAGSVRSLGLQPSGDIDEMQRYLPVFSSPSRLWELQYDSPPKTCP